jgi:hypothetical protein
MDDATEKPAAKARVLRAKPVKGEVDHAALNREFMARYPKLRAALAGAVHRAERKREDE